MDWMKIVGAALYCMVFLMVIGIGMSLMGKPQPVPVIVEAPSMTPVEPITPAAGPGIAWGQRQAARQVH